MKVAIAYDGVKPVGSKRRELSDKVVYAGIEEIGSFMVLKEGVIASVCNVDEIEQRILNGDGAN